VNSGGKPIPELSRLDMKHVQLQFLRLPQLHKALVFVGLGLLCSAMMIGGVFALLQDSAEFSTPFLLAWIWGAICPAVCLYTPCFLLGRDDLSQVILGLYANLFLPLVGFFGVFLSVIAGFVLQDICQKVGLTPDVGRAIVNAGPMIGAILGFFIAFRCLAVALFALLMTDYPWLRTIFAIANTAALIGPLVGLYLLPDWVSSFPINFAFVAAISAICGVCLVSAVCLSFRRWPEPMLEEPPSTESADSYPPSNVP